VAPVKVFVDADVLHKLYLRKLIFTLHDYELVQVLWTRDVFDESLRSLTRRFPNKQVGLYQMFSNYRSHFFDTEVKHFRHLVGQLGCSDINDEHVLAGAIAGQARHLLSFNLNDFPPDSEERFGVEICRPDEILARLLRMSTNADQIMAHWLSLFRQPEVSVASGAEALAQIDCHQLASLLGERHLGVEIALSEIRRKNIQ
jgi:hypothetical protein